MGSTQAYHDPEFLREVWGLYAVGVAILTLRSIVRLRTVGWRELKGDDWVSIMVFFCYTADAATVTETYLKGSNVDYLPDEIAEFDNQERQQVIFGSKMQLFAWYTYTALVWSLKACMLFFLNRLTFGLPSQKFVKALAVACVVTYIAVFLTITCSCYPIQRNWQIVPYPPPQCTLRAQNMYACTILNVMTDGAMLAIPMPLLWKLNAPLKKKLTLAVLLSSGVFVITAALVRIVMTLKAHPSALTVNRWGVRETIAGIFAVNLPIIRPFFSKAFWQKDMGRAPLKPGTPQTSGKSSRTKGSSMRKGEQFEMLDQAESTSQLHDTKSTARSTTRPMDGEGSDQDHDDDAASDDLIIQRESERQDIEQGGGGCNGRRGVLLQTSYSQSIAAAGENPIRVPQPAVHSHWQNGRFWDRGWTQHGYGNEVVVAGANSQMPR